MICIVLTKSFDRVKKIFLILIQFINPGVTPLIVAAIRNHHQVVTILLDNGADVNARSIWGEYNYS